MRPAGRMSVAPRLLAVGRVLAALVLTTSAACSSGAASSDAGTKSGAGGSGGTAGGVGGTGGVVDAASGVDGSATTTGQFTIVYSGTLTSTLTTCASCTGGYDLSGDGYAPMVFAMENAAGPPHTTGVDITIGPGIQGATNAVNLAVYEDNPTFASMYQGVYAYPNGVNWMNVGPGICFTFSEFNFAAGGGVSGSLDCDLMGSGVNNAQVAAHITGTFSSIFVY